MSADLVNKNKFFRTKIVRQIEALLKDVNLKQIVNFIDKISAAQYVPACEVLVIVKINMEPDWKNRKIRGSSFGKSTITDFVF